MRLPARGRRIRALPARPRAARSTGKRSTGPFLVRSHPQSGASRLDGCGLLHRPLRAPARASARPSWPTCHRPVVWSRRGTAPLSSPRKRGPSLVATPRPATPAYVRMPYACHTHAGTPGRVFRGAGSGRAERPGTPATGLAARCATPATGLGEAGKRPTGALPIPPRPPGAASCRSAPSGSPASRSAAASPRSG